MSRTRKDSPQSKAGRTGRGRRRNISVRAVRRDPVDYQKLARAAIALAIAQAEADAAATKPDQPNPSESEAADD